MTEEEFTQEQEESAMAIAEFIDMLRGKADELMAQNEILTQALVYMMRTNDLTTVSLNEADMGAIAIDLEEKGIHLHMKIDAEEDALWGVHFMLDECDDN